MIERACWGQNRPLPTKLEMLSFPQVVYSLFSNACLDWVLCMGDAVSPDSFADGHAWRYKRLADCVLLFVKVALNE